MNVLRHPFNFIPHYRVPGKININTIPPNGRNLTNSITPTGAAAESLVWEALVSDEYAMSALSWGTFKDSLYGSTPFPASGLPTHFANPFRPADSANLVPGVTTPTPIPEVDCTLLRSGIAAVGRPLFDYDSTEVSINSLRSAAFRNGLRTRLGNMVTTKSSLFAGWITVGYFQVNEDDELSDATGNPVTPTAGVAAEIGADRGDQVRNRAFFVFDRSIPVAYEPGKNHNVDKAIRVRTIID